MTNHEAMDQNLPIAEAFPIQDLKGWLSKQLQVPPGRQGIALFRDGKSALFPAGENQVITDLDRFKGMGAGFWAGYLPASSFPALLSINNLLSGDEALLDLSLLCTVIVSEPTRFFTEVVIPRRKISEKTFLLDDPELFKAFSNLVNAYAAQDLVTGSLEPDLIKRAYQVITPSLQGIGLSLDSIDLVTCWRQEDRLKIEQQRFLLEQKLADLEFEKQLAEAEDAGKLDEFMQANGVQIHAKVLSEDQAQESKASPTQVVKAWLNGQKESKKPGENFRIKSLVKKVKPEPPKIQNKVKWWVPRTVWIILVILISIALTILITHFSEQFDWKNRGEFYIPIWIFASGAILESVAALYKSWEKQYKNSFEVGSPITLDQLKIKDPQIVDRLIRDQTQMELGLQKDILNETRSRIYQGGAIEQALAFKRLERKIEVFQEKVKEKTFAVAPYLSPDITISDQTWATLMDNDETLLIKAAQLTEEAQQLQTDLSHASISTEALKQFESDLDGLYKSFAARERVLFLGKVNQN